MPGHIRPDFVIGRQRRRGFPNIMAVAVVSIVHIAVQKISGVILGPGYFWGGLIPGGLVIWRKTIQCPAAGDDLPGNRLGSRIGIVHRRRPQLLGRPGWKTIDRQQLQQSSLFCSQAVPIQAVKQVSAAARIELPLYLPIHLISVGFPFVNTIKEGAPVVLRSIQTFDLQYINRITLIPI